MNNHHHLEANASRSQDLQPRDLPIRDLPPRGNRYLETAVGTASPAKLRLMLIERAAEVAAGLADAWRETAPTEIASSHSLKLLDLLSELLGGVTAGGDMGLNQRVADLYVFLIQHLLAAESSRNDLAADEIRTVLEIEAETWRAVCAREAGAAPYADRRGSMTASDGSPVPGETTRQTGSSGLNLQA